MTIWRRIRGFLGTALSWAILWFAVGTALVLYQVVRGEGDFRDVLWWIGFVGGFYAACGATGGGIFALLLATAERRRSVNELSMSRVTMWGALGGLAIPTLFIVVFNRILSIEFATTVVSFALTAALGAVSAAGSLALARRAPAQLPPPSSDAGSLTRA